MSKRAVLASRSISQRRRVEDVLSRLDIAVEVASSSSPESLARDHSDSNLAIMDIEGMSKSASDDIVRGVRQSGADAMILIVGPGQLEWLRLPVDIPSDFMLSDGSDDELSKRVSLLLWPGNETSSTDVVTVDNLTLNLATYQVRVDDEPIDLTYQEYALLAFLATHPGKTYSRDTLLKRVWGFDYYGGSRTIDVHVRRIRAKLGPELARHLETVRGVGYLWNP